MPPVKRKRAVGGLKLTLADIDTRLDHVGALNGSLKEPRSDVKQQLAIARVWVAFLRSFKLDFSIFTYEYTVRYRCVGLSFIPPTDNPEKKVVRLNGFPVWENGAFCHFHGASASLSSTDSFRMQC